MSNLQNKTYGDFIPGALNWANIDFDAAAGVGVATQSNANNAISGVSPGINLFIQVTGVSTDGTSFYVRHNKNGVVGANSYSIAAGSTPQTVAVVNGDNISFTTGLTKFSGPAGVSATVSVYNASSSNTLLDTFTINMTVDG
jgi:hypothetical protein